LRPRPVEQRREYAGERRRHQRGERRVAKEHGDDRPGSNSAQADAPVQADQCARRGGHALAAAKAVKKREQVAEERRERRVRRGARHE
jgi:hypothetical protein